MKNKIGIVLGLLIQFGVYYGCQTTLMQNGKILRVIQGNIIMSQCQAIVNAANEQLAVGAGVCGAIFKAAGWNQLQQACDVYLLKNGVRCPTGQVRITDSFNLKSHGILKIIHAVGPDCRVIIDNEMQDYLLEQTYKNVLLCAQENKISSIAFPFISSAIFAFPKQRAAKIALETCMQNLFDNATVKIVEFVLFGKDDFDLFCEMLSDTNV